MGEPADEDLRRAEVVAHEAQVAVTLALGKAARAIRCHEHGQVRIARLVKPEQALQVDLARARGKQIAAAHHVVDTHERVVDGDGKLVGVHAVAASHKEVAAFLRQAFELVAVDLVGKLNRACGICGFGYAQAQRRRTHAGALANLLVGEGAAGACVNGRSVACVGSLCGMQLGARAEARVGEAHALEAGGVLLVYGRSLALEDGALVPVKAEPAQVVDERPGGTGRGLARVEVLDAQGERAALGAHGEPGDERTPHVSQVHAARRRGCEAAMGCLWHGFPRFG